MPLLDLTDEQKVALILQTQKYSDAEAVRQYKAHFEASSLLQFSDLRIWTRSDPPKFVDFKFNRVQDLLLNTLLRQQCVSNAWDLKGIRPHMLKSRQQGSSTFWLGVLYLKLYNLPYSQIVIITHRSGSTARRGQTPVTWEQDTRRRKNLPKLRHSNRRELVRE